MMFTCDQVCGSSRHAKRRRREAGAAASSKGEGEGENEGEEETPLEFERVLGRRLRDGEPEYLVKWRPLQVPTRLGTGGGGSSTITKGCAPAKGSGKGGAAAPSGAKMSEAAVASEWLPPDHIHDPVAVVTYDRGPLRAKAYQDWAWQLDPRGAGWSIVPLPLVDASSERARGLAKPENWPEGITYTPFLIWEPSRATELRLHSTLCVPWPTAVIRPLIETHPAHGHEPRESAAVACGLFARCAIPSGAWLGDFTGLVKQQEPEDDSRYLLEAFHHPTLGVRFDVDAQRFGNESRFINDFRDIAPMPNVAFMPYRAPATGELAIGVVALRAIRGDDEILADYGGAPSTDGAAHDADTSVAPSVDSVTRIISDGDDDAAPPIIVVTPTAAPAPPTAKPAPSWSQPPAPQQPPPPCSLPTPRPSSVSQPEPAPQPPLASIPAPPRPLPAPPPPPPLLSTSVAKAAGIVRRPQMPPATVTRDVRLEGYKALLVQLKQQQQQQQQQQAIQREAKRGLASDGR